jgi:hypothetical protein
MDDRYVADWYHRRRTQDQLQAAIEAGDLPRFKLLVQGGAAILDVDHRGFPMHREGPWMGALNQAAVHGEILIVEWLLAEGWANISDVDHLGYTVLLHAAKRPASDQNLVLVQWLLEHGGAKITDTTADGKTVWDLLLTKIPVGFARSWLGADQQLAALLRFMVLRGAPPADFVMQISPQHSRVVEEGAQLRAGLPAYLAQRRALLAEHTPLITTLWAIVSSYEEPTTTDELWATGLGALPVATAPRMRMRTHAQPQVEARHEGSRSCCCIC